MKLFGSLRWGGGAVFFIGLRGGGVEKHCTRASLHSDTVEDLIRLSVKGQVWKILMLERVCPAGLAEAKDQEAKLQELAIRGACDCNGG